MTFIPHDFIERIYSAFFALISRKIQHLQIINRIIAEYLKDENLFSFFALLIVSSYFSATLCNYLTQVIFVKAMIP